MKKSLIWAASNAGLLMVSLRMVPFLFTKGVLSGEKFYVLPPFLSVHYTDLTYLYYIVQTLYIDFRKHQYTSPYSSHTVNL